MAGSGIDRLSTGRILTDERLSRFRYPHGLSLGDPLRSSRRRNSAWLAPVGDYRQRVYFTGSERSVVRSDVDERKREASARWGWFPLADDDASRRISASTPTE